MATGPLSTVRRTPVPIALWLALLSGLLAAYSAVIVGARVIAICDAYDAMTSERPYGEARDAEAAIGELGREAGAQFDPRLVALFVDRVASAPVG